MQEPLWMLQASVPLERGKTQQMVGVSSKALQATQKGQAASPPCPNSLECGTAVVPVAKVGQRRRHRRQRHQQRDQLCGPHVAQGVLKEQLRRSAGGARWQEECGE